MITGSSEDKRDGYYKFKLLEVEKIKNDEYVIEITYNGLLYESIPVKDLTAKMPNVTGSSKLSDIPEQRDEINKKYSTIDKNSKTKSGGDAVQYNTDEPYESRRICDKEYEGQTDEGTACVQTTTTGYNVNADTITSGYKLIDSYDAGYDCITNVNLGLVRREEPNLVLVKDLDTVDITINGENHSYKYGDKDKKLLEEFLKDGTIKQPEEDNVASIYDLEPKLRFGDKYNTISYTRGISASDIKYDNNEGKYGEEVAKNRELEVTATYKIGMSNLANGLKMRVNELVDYYDEKFDPSSLEVYRIKEDGSQENIKVTTEGTVSSSQRGRNYNK